MPTLVDDEEFEDVYRPESSAPARGQRRGVARAPVNPAASNGDFADRTRSRRARATMLRDGYQDDFIPDAEDYPDDYEDEAAPRNNRRRVPVSRNGVRIAKRGFLSTKWGRVGLALAVVAVLGVLASIFMLVRGFFLHDPRFRIDSASSIQILGNSEISRSELLGIFGADVGHDIFTVPLAARRAELQQLPWVQSSTVMRLLPNQLRVSIVERVPVAFVREGSKIQLVDSSGVLLSMPPAMLAARHYSFPVVIGINPNDPPETRAERMQLYQKFVTELDASVVPAVVAPKAPPKVSTPVKVSQQLSEVDVSNPEDVRATMPSAGADILIHFGDEDFANRYRTYQQHLPQWRQQYPHLATVDLRYDQQTVLEMAKGADQDSANKVDTTPTLAATPAPKAKASARIPVTKSTSVKPAAVKPVVKAAVKPTRPGVYTAPVDNPRTHHG
jgi:cell division protein FtsQ